MAGSVSWLLKKHFPWTAEKCNERNIYNIIVILRFCHPYMSSFPKGLSNEFGSWRCAFRFRWQLGFKLTLIEQNILVPYCYKNIRTFIVNNIEGCKYEFQKKLSQ